jgi:hypothetical protein
MLDAIDSATGHAAKTAPQTEERRRRGHPGGSMAAKARARLAADGVEIDDPSRPPEGRRRKPAKEPPPPGLRDGPTLPLRNLRHEEAARHVAAGLPERDAWVMAGYAVSSLDYLRVMREQDFLDRVVEFRDADRTAHGVSLPFLKQRLLRIALSDPGQFFEPIPHTSGRWRAKDLLSLPPELRSCISEVNFDKNGRPLIKLHDRVKALTELARLIGPSKVEVSGPNGGPLDVALSSLVDRLFAPEALNDADAETLNALAQVEGALRLLVDRSAKAAEASDGGGDVVDAEYAEVDGSNAGGTG